MRAKAWLRAVLVLAAVGFSSTAAEASSFAVTPTTIALRPGAATAVLTVENRDKVTLRFELKAVAWDQAADGRPVYHPTEDLIFFPPLLTVAPGEKRLIRIGTEVPFGATERSYRLFLYELPPLEKPGGAGMTAQITVLTNVGVPVFLEPARTVASPGLLDGLRLQGGELDFTVKNDGNVRLVVLGTLIRALDGRGGVVFSGKARAGYVLAGGRLHFHLHVPERDCSKAHKLTLTTTVEQPTADGNFVDKTLEGELRVEAGACGGLTNPAPLKSL